MLSWSFFFSLMRLLDLSSSSSILASRSCRISSSSCFLADNLLHTVTLRNKVWADALLVSTNLCRQYSKLFGHLIFYPYHIYVFHAFLLIAQKEHHAVVSFYILDQSCTISRLFCPDVYISSRNKLQPNCWNSHDFYLLFEKFSRFIITLLF